MVASLSVSINIGWSIYYTLYLHRSMVTDLSKVYAVRLCAVLCLRIKFSRCTKFWVYVSVLPVDLRSKFTGCATKLVRSSTAVLECEWLYILNLVGACGRYYY